MNPQTVSAIRILLLVGLTWLGNHGYGNAKDLAAFSDPAVIEAFFGILGVIATAAWGLWERRPTAIIKAALKLDPQGTIDKAAVDHPVALIAAAATVPAVSNIVTDPSIAAAIPSGKVVAAT